MIAAQVHDVDRRLARCPSQLHNPFVAAQRPGPTVMIPLLQRLLAGRGRAAGPSSEAPDDSAALGRLAEAAAAGDAAAMYNLGLRYDRGHGVPADPDAARAWYEPPPPAMRGR